MRLLAFALTFGFVLLAPTGVAPMADLPSPAEAFGPVDDAAGRCVDHHGATGITVTTSECV